MKSETSIPLDIDIENLYHLVMGNFLTSAKGRLTRIGNWAVRSLTAFDVFINVFLLVGLEDETISAHTGRAMLEGKLWGKVGSYLLEYCPLFGTKHVQGAIVHDEERAEVIVKTEEAAQKLETGADQKIV